MDNQKQFNDKIAFQNKRVSLSMPIRIHLRNVLLILSFVILNGPGVIFPQGNAEKARSITREVEFDYVNWTLDALWTKITHKYPRIWEEGEYKAIVYSYINLISSIQQLNSQIAMVYANPDIADPDERSRDFTEELLKKQSQLKNLSPLVETILQKQVSSILLDEGIDMCAIVFPPVLYRTSEVPLALLLSPREHIQLDANISLSPGLSEAQIVTMEKEIETELSISALIEEVGGLGTYPAMIMMTTDLNWLIETIAHEWIHNYLALQPLGFNYETSTEMRTMNETTANLAGKEIGEKAIAQYYPERIQSPPSSVTSNQAPVDNELPVFDFREEMRITREQVDRFLAAGKIDEAEAYMNMRQRAFWNNGYLIRRINQAYFAFHGAYNDTPGGGASGTDPVGPAVVELREKCERLGDFLKKISGVSSYTELKAVLTDGCD